MKYEFKLLRVTNIDDYYNLEETLNLYGEARWKIISVNAIDNGFIYHFMREKV